MRAVIITEPGGVDVLQFGDVGLADPDPHEIRVRVHATAVNRADILQRRGHYPAPAGVLANVPGLEYAGEVSAVGANVTRWRIGDRVMGLVGGGGYAEAVVVHEDEAIAIPDALSYPEAASIPEAFLTAYDALRTRLHVLAGESVLVHAVASGVGTAASQLARAFGCSVFGTARSAWKIERALGLGVDIGIDTSVQDFVDVIQSHGGVDCIVDLVGGDYLNRNLQCLKPLGRIVLVGLVAGRSAPLDMGMTLSKRATIVGTVMRTRLLDEKISVASLFAREVLPLLASGAVVPVVDRVLSIADVGEAHRVVEANENFGKVVMVW